MISQIALHSFQEFFILQVFIWNILQNNIVNFNQSVNINHFIFVI